MLVWLKVADRFPQKIFRNIKESCRQIHGVWEDRKLYCISSVYSRHNVALGWRHNGRDGVSNHRHLDCLLNCLFSFREKKPSKLRVTGLCEGNPPVTGGFPSQWNSNAENFSPLWRHHGNLNSHCLVNPISHGSHFRIDRRLPWVAVLIHPWGQSDHPVVGTIVDQERTATVALWESGVFY